MDTLAILIPCLLPFCAGLIFFISALIDQSQELGAWGENALGRMQSREKALRAEPKAPSLWWSVVVSPVMFLLTLPIRLTAGIKHTKLRTAIVLASCLYVVEGLILLTIGIVYVVVVVILVILGLIAAVVVLLIVFKVISIFTGESSTDSGTSYGGSSRNAWPSKISFRTPFGNHHRGVVEPGPSIDTLKNSDDKVVSRMNRNAFGQLTTVEDEYGNIIGSASESSLTGEIHVENLSGKDIGSLKKVRDGEIEVTGKIDEIFDTGMFAKPFEPDEEEK
jgi:hypothetical protein